MQQLSVSTVIIKEMPLEVANANLDQESEKKKMKKKEDFFQNEPPVESLFVCNIPELNTITEHLQGEKLETQLSILSHGGKPTRSHHLFKFRKTNHTIAINIHLHDHPPATFRPCFSPSDSNTDLNTSTVMNPSRFWSNTLKASFLAQLADFSDGDC
ncbi:hypothetical protein L2E82_13265 [Cichorium intybus]|uniref:Uncharacterized protein n=1 Tax=Cichorium intybus TaxID=13427 RepID=A0ACB9GJK0_CICIN|nr:hypothetical protein L2E82_13265 [Cichorium intybus]